ncbi:hypothetical protein WKK05_11690 [Nostoc sp. UHCC 0302]|uniref:hypothetical protein n=1 Tax=Nostoc sp. UHCC 0302 TaxID=3134896 RepID=UPI00311CDB24
MSRPFKIEIAESEEELKKRLQTANLGNQKEKLIMLWWIKSWQVKEQQEIENAWQKILQQSRDGCRSPELMGYQAY